jgi:hypothetical protein
LSRGKPSLRRSWKAESQDGHIFLGARIYFNIFKYAPILLSIIALSAAGKKVAKEIKTTF